MEGAVVCGVLAPHQSLVPLDGSEKKLDLPENVPMFVTGLPAIFSIGIKTEKMTNYPTEGSLFFLENTKFRPMFGDVFVGLADS